MTLGAFLIIAGIVLSACAILLQLPTSLVVSTALAICAFASVAATIVFTINHFSSNR